MRTATSCAMCNTSMMHNYDLCLTYKCIKAAWLTPTNLRGGFAMGVQAHHTPFVDGVD